MQNTHLKHQVLRQLRFIENSCVSFDNGFKDEAVRIATTIRVLIHDTKKSRSLLGLLDVKDKVKIISTIQQPDTKNITLFDGISTFTMNGVQPNLEIHNARIISISDWWDEIAIIYDQSKHTRKSIILNAADKDGGAHVDPTLTKEYEQLKNGLYYFSSDNTAQKEISDIQYTAIRVFANELINSSELRTI